MEITGEDGLKLVLGRESVAVFGRGSGFPSEDRTVSRHHLLLKIKTPENRDEEPMVSFEVIGRNPIWVRSGMDEEIRAFRRSEKGEIVPGDTFCVGWKQPTWFGLKRVAKFEEGKEDVSAESSGHPEDIDVSGIDPVKEFGFLVKGHEFDCYGNRVIRDAKKWDWFLEEPRRTSEDDEDYGLNKRRKRIHRVKSDDEEWTDEDDDTKKIVAKTKKVQRPKYSTRSKDRNEPHKNTGGSKAHVAKKAADRDHGEEEEEEILGGFIVDDEVENEEIMDEEEEEEEEEVLDDDNDDDD